MTEKSLITEEMRAAIGQPLNSGKPFDVEKGAIRNMAEAMNYLNPLYLDEAYARSKGHISVLAPHMLPTYDLNLGAPLEMLKFPFDIIAGLHGSDEWEFILDVHAGDVLTPQGKLLDLVEKDGSRGKMLFITSEITYTNQRGEVVAIYRPTEIMIAK
jgi:acyl dehydratase